MLNIDCWMQIPAKKEEVADLFLMALRSKRM